MYTTLPSSTKTLPAHHLLLMVVYAVLGWCLAAAQAQDTRQVVIISHQVTNLSETDAADVRAVCILPMSNQYQDVDLIEVDPAPEEIRRDQLGQQVVTVSLGDIPAGHQRSVRAVAWVRLKRVERLKSPPGKPQMLTPEELKYYLADGDLLQLDRVRHLTSIIVSEANGDLDKASRLYDYLIHNCIYMVDNQFDPAPLVLSLFPASCSELAYTYVAMCRSVGLPARLVSAYVSRAGRQPSSDWQNYRWAEVYIPEYGWIPADPTTRINHPDFRHFGRQDQRFLGIVDDCQPLAGGDDPEWRVLLAQSETPDVEFSLRRTAMWRVSENRDNELAAFRDAGRKLRADAVAVRRQFVESFRARPTWLRVPFLLQALSDADRDVRLSAARGLGSTEDATLLLGLAKIATKETDPQVKTELLNTARSYLTSKSGATRAAAVRSLCKSKTPEALDLINGMWRDPDWAVRTAVVESIPVFGRDPRVLEGLRYLESTRAALIREADDDRNLTLGAREYVPIMATVALARLGDSSAVGSLAATASGAFTPCQATQATQVLPIDCYEESWKNILAQQALMGLKLKWPSRKLYKLMMASEGSSTTRPGGESPSLTSLIQQPEAVPPTYRPPPSELEYRVPNRYLEEKTTRIRPPKNGNSGVATRPAS